MSLISIWLATLTVAFGQLDAMGSTRVAVVDIPAVSERYEGTADLEAQFEERRTQFNSRREEFRDKINRTGRTLQEQLKPGTPEFEQRQKQLVMLEAELDWFTQVEGKKIEQGLAQSLHEIYLAIHAAVEEIALERGIDVVLAADRLPVDPPQSTTQARQQIVLQKVVYWTPRVDLTEAVITRLNERFRARRLTTPNAAGPK